MLWIQMDTNILDLPIDALILICEQLKTFDDKRNFADAHPKLWDSFAYCSRKEVQSEICFKHEDYAIHWDFYLEWWGSKLTSIDNSCNYVDSGDLMDIAAKFCPNLSTVMFMVKENNIKRLEDNLSKLKMLKGVKMFKVCKPQKDHNIFETLQSLTNLRSLHYLCGYLNKNERTQLNKLIQLEDLRITSIAADDVRDLSTLLGHLRVLQINHIDTTSLSQLAEHSTNLEKLIIECYRNITIFPYFPKLIYLGIRKVKALYNLVSQLKIRYNDQLQDLQIHLLTVDEKAIVQLSKLRALKHLICGDTSPILHSGPVGRRLYQICMEDITQFDILRLVKECKSLNIIDCNTLFFDEEFLPRLLDLLETRGFQPDRPFCLNIAAQNEVKAKLMSQLASISNSNILHIT